MQCHSGELVMVKIGAKLSRVTGQCTELAHLGTYVEKGKCYFL